MYGTVHTMDSIDSGEPNQTQIYFSVFLHSKKEMASSFDPSCSAPYFDGFHMVVWCKVFPRRFGYFSCYGQFTCTHCHVLLLWNFCTWTRIQKIYLVEKIPDHLPNGLLPFFIVTFFLIVTLDAVCGCGWTHVKYRHPISKLHISNCIQDYYRMLWCPLLLPLRWFL